jgi:FKBP-type peptidyl-prolyl cis-trans isomerase
MGIEIIKKREGDGINYPKNGQVVRVHFDTYLDNGNKICSSRDDNRPFSFVLGDGEVIKAWDQTVAEMSLGEIILLKTTPEMAYGSKGIQGLVPQNANLKFEIELLSFI